MRLARPSLRRRARSRHRRPARGRGRAGRCSSGRARRSGPAPSPGDLGVRLDAGLAAARRPALRRVLNATGVLVHTNLGRAPLAAGRARPRRRGRARLLEPRVRPRRRAPAARARITWRRLLRRLTGARGRDRRQQQRGGAAARARRARRRAARCVVSRGELIEIGDGFRIPDVLARSGARLVEVGTTNRTRAADYERAIGAGDRRCSCACTSRTSASSASPSSLGSRSSRRSRAGTSCRSSTTSARARSSTSTASRRPPPALAAGADLVCFSGDKLLGGPQAGIVAGRADLVERLRRHPLQRALRADKLTLAALEGTLLALPRRAGRDPGAAHAARAGRDRARAGGAARRGGRRLGRGDGRPRRRRRAPARRAAELRLRGRGGARGGRCGPTSRPSSPSSATAARCSTAARSPTPRPTRSRRRSRGGRPPGAPRCVRGRLACGERRERVSTGSRLAPAAGPCRSR